MKKTLILMILAVSMHSQERRFVMPPNQVIAIRAGRLFDSKSGALVSNQTILIRGDRIAEVGSSVQIPREALVLDLTNATVMPGMIDAHVHVNTGGETPAQRAIVALANAQTDLQAGFTTVRDVESEGSGYADVALRTAIERGLIEGPRMQVATRAIAATGGYFPERLAPDLNGFPRGAQMITGADEARRAAHVLVCPSTAPPLSTSSITPGK